MKSKSGIKKEKGGDNEKNDSEFEEVTFKCSGCGREIKMVKLKGLATDGLLCQSCSKGEMKIDND